MKLIIGIIIVTCIIAVYLLATVKIYKQVKTSKKVSPLWLLLIMFFPIIGPAVYLANN